MTGWLDGMRRRQAARAWEGAADALGGAGPDGLRALQAEARQMRATLDRVLHCTDARLAAHRPWPALPLGTDWQHRPELWAGPISPPGCVAPASGHRLGAEAEVFHDAGSPDLSIRQVAAPGGAARGVVLDMMGFDGSFLSIVLGVPESGVEGLRRRHVLRLDATITAEVEMEIFARLNVRHGPNTEQIVRELPVRDGARTVEAEFDLAYSDLNEKRVEAMWLDLIFEGAAMNEVRIADLVLSRHPRAEI